MISVIIPTYNRTKLLLERTLPSVFNQTLQDFEIHVIGDGTEQATVDAMEELCSKDSRVRFTNLPHQEYPAGRTMARWAVIGLVSLNYGLDHALGDWIAVLADDDAWTPDHNEVLLNAALETGADHVYGISTGWNEREQSTGQVWGSWPPGDGKLANGANLYKASLPYRYDTRCWVDRRRTGDADLWLRMIEGGVKFHFVPQIVHKYYPSKEGQGIGG